MLDELSQAFSIDPARVYATGYSNGGGMADRLACDLSDRIAAAGQVAGTYLPNPGCEPGRPVPVLTLHGTDDTILPYGGTEGGTLSASGWAANWATRNGCTGESSVTFEDGAVTGETWTGCLDGADVVFYTVEGGGHDWFRTEPVPDTTWPTTDIDANAALWAFFEAHPMPENPSEAVPVPEEAVFLPVMGEYSLEIESGGLSRQTVVHVPRGYEDGVPTPLVIAFHGRGDSAVGFAVGSGLINMADEGGFVVAFPQGAGEPTGWDALPVQELTDDVQFTRDLIDALAERLSIDPARVYATGFSAGGRMVNRLGCDLADRIAAISPVGAGAYPSDACAPVRPVPVFAVHGDADTAAPYDGDELDPPVQTWVGDWAMRNGCDAEPVLDARHVMLSAGEVRIGVQTWESCDRDAAVSLYTYEGLGHVWPSGAGLEAMWAFFEAHPMSPADTGDAGGGD
jgi:polyhydroxybutyrate depolymerase